MYKLFEYCYNYARENGKGILESEWHDGVLEGAPFGCKSCLESEKLQELMVRVQIE